MDIISLLARDNYIILNKDLMRLLGINEAILLGELASEYRYFSSNGKLSEDGSFFCTIENMEKSTGLSRYQQKKALDTLREKGVVDVYVRGLPAKRYIRINEGGLMSLFQYAKN